MLVTNPFDSSPTNVDSPINILYRPTAYFCQNKQFGRIAPDPDHSLPAPWSSSFLRLYLENIIHIMKQNVKYFVYFFIFYYNEYMLENIRRYRQDLHQIPELELDLPKTQNYILNILNSYPCQICSPIPSSVIAYFNNHKKKTIAFRSDMDALPVEEKTSCTFKSRHNGRMHACGHDGHMAMLLGLADYLKENYKRLNVNVLLIFQPGEESPGGAKLMCQTGFLDIYHVCQIYGTHLWPNLKKGLIATKIGPMMARSSEVDIDIHGKKSHAASYQQGIDALEIAANYLTEIYSRVKEIPGEVPYLLRFGKMYSGDIRNVVSDHTRLEGTLRALDDAVYHQLTDILKSTAKKYPGSFDFHITEGYPPVKNDATLIEKLLTFLPDLVLLNKHEMISEDFSWYQQYVPGVFFFLGTGTKIPLHNDHFDFDEIILEKGVQNYIQILEHTKSIG